MKTSLIAAFLLFYLLLLGCSVKYTANSVTNLNISSKEICIIEDTSVREPFLAVYRNALGKKGFVVRTLSPGSDIASCPLTSTYTGEWSWDFVSYMSYAEIFVYRDGILAGNALYKAPCCGWALTFKIYEKTDTKIAKMVDQLFPDTGYSK